MSSTPNVSFAVWQQSHPAPVSYIFNPYRAHIVSLRTLIFSQVSISHTEHKTTTFVAPDDAAEARKHTTVYHRNKIHYAKNKSVNAQIAKTICWKTQSVLPFPRVPQATATAEAYANACTKH